MCVGAIASGALYLKRRRGLALLVWAAAVLACVVLYLRPPGPGSLPPAPTTVLAPDPEDFDIDPVALPVPAPDPNEVDLDPQGPPPEVRIDYDAHAVVRTGPARWSTHLDGYLGQGRNLDLLHDSDRVYVKHGGGVTALDGRSGKVLWHSAGPGDFMYLSSDLLLAADGRVADRGRSLAARAVATGAEVFRVGLPPEAPDLLTLADVAGLFVVQPGGRGGEGPAVLFDRRGQVRHRFDRQVVAGRVLGEDRVLLTCDALVRLSPTGKVRWSAPFEGGPAYAGGQVLELPGGDLLASRYWCFADAGVEVVRLGRADGVEVWRAYCAGLGVAHSNYRHRAEVEIDGEFVKVTSRGLSGTFVELLDLGSGRQLGREQRLRH
jgi:hypothetical protein